MPPQKNGDSRTVGMGTESVGGKLGAARPLMGRGGAMYESIHVRITVEQYEWLRRYCFENRVAQAEVVREALDMFRNQKEAQTKN